MAGLLADTGAAGWPLPASGSLSGRVPAAGLAPRTLPAYRGCQSSDSSPTHAACSLTRPPAGLTEACECTPCDQADYCPFLAEKEYRRALAGSRRSQIRAHLRRWAAPSWTKMDSTAPIVAVGISSVTRATGSQTTVPARLSARIRTSGVSLRKSAAVVRGVLSTCFLGPSPM